MSGPKKRRKAYRPKPIARPILQKMRDELVLPAYSALEVLRISDDAMAMESARHTLAALCNTARLAGDKAGMPTHAARAGQDALRTLIARRERTGSFRPTGPELQALRAAVTWFDGAAGAMNTSHIVRAVAEIHHALFNEPESIL